MSITNWNDVMKQLQANGAFYELQSDISGAPGTSMNLFGIVFGASGVYDKSYTLAKAPGLISVSYKAAVEAAEKSSTALEFLGKVTGGFQVFHDFNEAQQNYADGRIGYAVWDAAKGIGTAAIMLFGGEEAELAWNLGTMTIDAV